MAGPLAAIERFFERVFERPPARLFAPRLDRDYLLRELIRAMEAERDVRGRRTYVPTFYRVQLSNADYAGIAAQSSLGTALAEGLRAHARSHDYVLGGRPTVSFERAATLEAGEVAVEADNPQLAGLSRPTQRRNQPIPSSGRLPAPPPPKPARPANGADRGDGADPSHTSMFEAAKPHAPRAVISVQVPGRAPWRIAINSGRLRVGRALDNDLVLSDDRVSRYHGQISVRFGTLVYADLGSTNGSFVNGARVSEIALGTGDVLQVGGSALTVEPGQ